MSSTTHDRVMEMARPLTPKSERSRASYGSLMTSVQTVPGLCLSRKCVRKAGHEGECWPAEEGR